MTAIGYLERPPPSWFVLDVMRREKRSWNWVALMVDYDPEDYDREDPDGMRPPLDSKSAWVRVQGKHRNRDAAWDAFEQTMDSKMSEREFLLHSKKYVAGLLADGLSYAEARSRLFYRFEMECQKYQERFKARRRAFRVVAGTDC